MKCTIPEISWHNREPVLSVDIHPVSNEFYKLASGGGDSHVLIWQMTITENGAVKQDVVSDLTRHQKAVNCVRWSPDGKYLASADDDANIIVWQLKTDNVPLLEGDTENKETWVVYKVMRGHKEDIYDLSWSIDGTKLFSGSVDNTAVLWDLAKGKMEHILTDHKGFVQGVSWDPKNQYLSSISTDRICRLFDISGKHVKARIQKGMVPVPPNHFLSGKEVKYFHDDTFKSFFRRLEFSPDGSLLLVPSGRMEAEDCKKVLCATLMFTMDNFNVPAAILPIPNQCSTVVRFCPVLFTLREDGPEPVVKLPYRMVFAVGTDHDIILYDTQQKQPFARFHEIHYTRLTDLTWSQDGLLLTASSTDGFCALVTFDVGELGTVYVKEDSESEETQTPVEVQEKVEMKEQTNTVVEKKRPSFLEKWALNTPPKKTPKKNIDPEEVIEILDEENDAAMDQDETEELSQEIKDQIRELIPSRTASITAVNSSQEANSIEIRKRSRDETTQEAKPIEVRKKPRTDTIQEAKPIEVRKKPRAEIFSSDAKGKTPDQSSSSALAIATQGAKPIEVRKQPRSLTLGDSVGASNTSANATQKPQNVEVIKKLKEKENCDKHEVQTVELNDTSDEDSSDGSDEDEEAEQLSQNIKDEISNLLPTKATFKGVGSIIQGGQNPEERQKPREDTKEKINVLIPRKKSSLQQNDSEKNREVRQAEKIKSNESPRNDSIKENGHDGNDVKLPQQAREQIVNILTPKKALVSTITSINSDAKPIQVRKHPRNSKTDCSNVEGITAQKSNQNLNDEGSKKEGECRLGLEKVSHAKDVDDIHSSSQNDNKHEIKDDKLSSETEKRLCTEDIKEPSMQSPNKKDTKTVEGDNTSQKVEGNENKTKNDKLSSETEKRLCTQDIKEPSMQSSNKKDTKTVKEDNTPQKRGGNENKTKDDKLSTETEKRLCTENIKEPRMQSSNKNGTKTVKEDNTPQKGGTEEVIVISNENDRQKLSKKGTGTAKNKTSSTKKKKDDTPNKTPKTTPSARKKLCTTPPTNSLLNFLKRSDSKKKSTRPSTVIDLTDGDEARDGWSEAKSAVEEDKDNLGVTPMEEDHTEDFCLRLEDTQDAETDKEKLDKGEKESLKNSEHLNEVKLEEKKVPRRVPLITLSSPKSKKTSNT